MGKKLLIACGTALYDHLAEDQQRPLLGKIVQSVAGLFTGMLGYSRVLEEISHDPTSDQLAKKLDRWFASEERNNSDWVVFYYTGHGELLGDSLYLLTRDSENGLLASTAFSLDKLGEMIISKDARGENRRVKRCLLIIDTCFSGAGTLVLSRKLNTAFCEGTCAGMYYVLAAAFPNEEALTGALARALIQALEDESLSGPQQPVIYFDQLLPAINRRLSAHKVLYAPLASPDEEPQFFPNPRYIRGLPPSATVEDIRRATASGELYAFWGPTARGVELELQPGWYFTGRDRVLHVLSQWLQDDKDDRTRVITGSPGSGKSAILSKIVTLSDGVYRKNIPASEAYWNRLFPEDCIHLAIHAKGKTFQEVVDRFAEVLGIQKAQSKILAALKSRGEPFHVLLDALDEAREPERIARELLEPLHSIPRVKVLVGTRREHAERLGHDSVKISIDQSDYFNKNDLVRYVRARLLRENESATSTPYHGHRDRVTEIAKAVSEKAYPNFLIARLVVEDLLALPSPLDSSAIAEGDFPATVDKAFERFLSRFGTRERHVRHLLAPLAWAEGLGLPWGEIWPALASVLSGSKYSSADIQWLLEHAGSFVVEGLEEGRSVYRLYHQALADYLRQGREKTTIQRLIVTVLEETVPRLAEGGKDWRLAHTYIRSHLAEHAATSELLASLLTDPLFLLTANPERLLAVMDTWPEQVSSDIAHVYKGAFHHLEAKSLSEAAAYLEMTARKSMQTAFADQVIQLPLHWRWSVPWARWMPVSTHRILTEQAGMVTSLAVTEWQGRAVILSGTHDAKVCIWDMERGEMLGPPLLGHTARITALAVTELQGRPVIVSASADNKIRIWDMDRGEGLGSPLSRHTGPVTAIAIGERLGRTVIVSAGLDSTIWIWDLEKGEVTGALVRGESPLTALILMELRDRRVVISGSQDGSIQIWDLEQGTAMGSLPSSDRSSVTALAVADQRERKVIICGSQDGSIHMWDLERGETIGPRFNGHRSPITAFITTQKRGREVIVSSSYDDNIRVWDLDRGGSFAAPLAGHTGPVMALAVAEREGRIAIISGGTDESIRIWDLERDEATDGRFAHHTDWVTALAVAARRGKPLVVSGSYDETVRIWSLDRGDDIDQVVHAGKITALAVARRENQTLIVSGSEDGSIRTWSLERTEELGKPLIGHMDRIRALAAGEWEGRTVIASGSYDGTIRIWDVERCEEAHASLTTARKSATALAFAKRFGKTVIVFGNADHTIRVWDPLQTQEVEVALVGHTGWITTLAVGLRKGRTVIISSGYDRSIRVWDLERAQAVGGPLAGHTGWVRALTVAEQQGRAAIVSGGDDHTVRFWDLESFVLLETVDVGAPVCSIICAPPSTVVVGTWMGLVALQLHRM